MIKSMKSPRRLAAVAVFAIVAMSAFGFAATNAVPDSVAGDGAGDVSGGDVTDIEWMLRLPAQHRHGRRLPVPAGKPATTSCVARAQGCRRHRRAVARLYADSASLHVIAPDVEASSTQVTTWD
ncbi:MAG: hypothetical protein IPH65_10080 [Dehalococcoidia bacterium]|uniref:hypothetical protein n=1 Tax=Candidatus Amarobacter glycogenicus TaxID=3140699 RepID=UPI0031373873|nr:hypothetical protein [Dehalococcoidia bacterium]